MENAENFLEVFNRQGYVLMWSDVLQERIVYHADGLARADLPRGVVLYSESELKIMYDDDMKADLTARTIKRIHHAKKQDIGMRVTEATDDV